MQKSSKQKASLAKDELLIFKNKVRGTKAPINLIFDVRNLASPVAYSDAIAWIRSQPLYRNAVFNPDFPSSVRQINEVRLLLPTSAARELRWAGAYLSSHGSSLTEFVRLSLDFQQSLLLNEYDASQQALDKVQGCFGYSLWLIRNRITLLQVAEGLEAQKKYTKKVQEELRGVHGVVNYIIYAMSARCEPALPPARFVAAEMDRIASVSSPNLILSRRALRAFPLKTCSFPWTSNAMGACTTSSVLKTVICGAIFRSCRT